jgi:hypothetical protein
MLALPCIDLRQLGKADSDATVLATESFGLLYRYCEEALGICIVALLHGLLPRRHGRFPGLLLTGEKKREQQTPDQGELMLFRYTGRACDFRLHSHRRITTEEYTMIEPGRYRHYKGNDYEVIGVAKHSETEELFVVYRALYGERGLWVRPAAMFLDTVIVDGLSCPRFQRLHD